MGYRLGFCREDIRDRTSRIHGKDQLRAKAVPSLAYANLGCTGDCLASMSTKTGRKIITDTPNYQGSLGTAISEAIELAIQTPNCKSRWQRTQPRVSTPNRYRTGSGKADGDGRGLSRRGHRLLWGGSNFSGISFPFLRHKIVGKNNCRFVAAEPASCPKLTRGEFKYDFGDESGHTPLIPMYTLGHKFAPANIHAGGLRYHGAGSIVSQLLKDELIEAVSVKQLESFEAGILFAQTEGIVPAPESTHAIAVAIREALKAKEEGTPKTILFNLSGHGLVDMSAYDQYLAGDLTDHEVSDEEIKNSRDEITT